MASTRSNKTAPLSVRRKAAARTVTRPMSASPSPSEPTAPNGGSGRQRRAISTSRPSGPTPAAPIAEPEKVQRKPKASQAASPINLPPSASPAPIPRNGGGGGHQAPETQSGHAVVAICRQLAAHQRKRKFCIKSQSMHDRSVESLIASVLGFRLDASEAERKRVFGEAKRIRQAVEKVGDGQPPIVAHTSNAVADLIPIILTNAASRSGWDDMRGRVEKEMTRLVRRLPIYPFASAITGLGDKGLAIIVGESGIPLSKWRTTSGLWKHMGLAVIDGYRQKGRAGKRETDEERSKYFDCPERRGQIIGAVADPLFKSQWAAAKDEDGNNPEKSDKPIAVPAHPDGPYGEIYAHRRAETKWRIAATEDLPQKHPDKWTKGRCFNDARRVMIKELLSDLRTAWRRAERDAAQAAGDGQDRSETQEHCAVAIHPEQSGAGGHGRTETHRGYAPGETHWAHNTALADVPREALDRIAAIATAAGGATYVARPNDRPPRRSHSRQSDATA